MTMRLIDADALMEAMSNETSVYFPAYVDLVKNAPTVQSIPIEIIEAVEALLKADMTAALSGGSLQRHLPEPLLELRRVFRKYVNAPAPKE